MLYEVITKQTDFSATANGESISGTYRLQLNNAGWHDITGTDIAKYGYNYYRVLFTSRNNFV